ncbi:MAG: hypothetical protein RXR52_20215 [Paraburkholderia sp.]|uniref:cation-transporting P-type ATPase n=1 Tax=Paraburkholderia sp. TaxID=1926495 RepID=UPI00397BB366
MSKTDRTTGRAAAEAQHRLQLSGANAIKEVRTPRWRQLLGKPGDRCPGCSKR